MKVLDLRKEGDKWKFLFCGDDFEADLEVFKASIPLSHRVWNKDDHCWEVPIGLCDSILDNLFENWAKCASLVNSQGTLW